MCESTSFDINKLSTLPSICNLKAHINLKGLSSCIKQLNLSLEGKEKNQVRNYIVVREKFIYTIFPRHGYINVSNIKNWEELLEVLPHFANSFNVDIYQISEQRLKVDNTTSGGHFRRQINLVKLKELFNNNIDQQFPKAVFHYDRNRFPGAFLKSKSLGTAVLHTSGGYSIIGAKSQKDIDFIYSWMCAYIAKL
jgi:TATA-box binding protein (TBP) (component of TFIID and TFIIIB)